MFCLADQALAKILSLKHQRNSKSQEWNADLVSFHILQNKGTDELFTLMVSYQEEVCIPKFE